MPYEEAREITQQYEDAQKAEKQALKEQSETVRKVKQTPPKKGKK